MANPLSEANWTSLTKKLKLDLDDAALVKTLARLDKTDPAKPEPRLDALKDLIEQIKKQTLALAKRKKELGDKPFAELKSKLDDLLDLAEREQKAMRSAADSSKEADEEEESPILLTTKMLPLLREIRKGEVRMHALIGVAGKACAVLILRRSISPARRKLIAETLGATGGIKYIVGECLFENKILTFVVQSQAAGLAKKLRQALLDQTQLRFKVKVRGEDGEDEHGEDEEDATAAAAAPATVAAPAATATPAPATAAAAPAAPAADANAGPAFKARLEALLPRLKPGLPGADVARAKATEAGVLTRSRDWAGAARLLDEAEAALAAATVAAAPERPRGTIAPSIVYTQSRLAWLASRKKVEGELKKLEQAILARYKTSAALPAVTEGVRKLDRVLEVFDESLADTLDAALNAADPAVKQRFHEEARGIIRRYEDFLKTDPIVRELDANPFVPIAVQSTLTSTLSVLATKII
ncbi:MAG TPA: hypothetical protein VGM81_26585 [Burkholderiaceae bacterium]|jgi:hypothetical protein